MLLEVKNLSVHYGKAQALRDVSLVVGDDEIVAIIGANGAGKTTILKSISGLVTATSGEIWFDGHKINRRPPEKIARRGIGICMEGRRLFPFMTVLENLQMGAFSRKDKNMINQDLERVFVQFPVLSERQNQKAGTLSGGEQQMLTIARTLMSKPKLLMLDEPSLGLAPIIVKNITRIIKDLNKNGLPILLIEQNAQMALTLAQRGYVLEVGAITTQGDTQSLRGNKHVKEAYLGA